MERLIKALSNSDRTEQEVKEIVKDLKDIALNVLMERGSLDDIDGEFFLYLLQECNKNKT